MGYEMETEKDIALSESDYDRLVTHNIEQGEYISELCLTVEMLKVELLKAHFKINELENKLALKKLD